jgi:hypothetical protein
MRPADCLKAIPLTATTLIHDPGNFFHRTAAGRYTVNVGTPRVIPWAELTEDCLVLTEGRLALLHGGEEVVIGRCLRPPEREWLAEVLRSWIRQHSP